MKLNQTLIMNAQGNKLLLDKDGYLVREDFQGNRQSYALGTGGGSGSGSAASTEITEIEVINGTGSALEVDAKSLEELKSTYLFGPLMDAAIIFPIFDSLPQTLDKACEKTVEIWLQNNFNITTIDFGTSTVINSDSIPTELEPANHVFTVRISYTPDLGAGSVDQCIKKIAVNYAYSFDII